MPDRLVMPGLTALQVADLALDWNQVPWRGQGAIPRLVKETTMRPLTLAIAASGLMLVADAAAQSRYPVTDSEAISSVQVRAPARTVRVYQEHLDALRGVYVMSNGWRMKVSSAAGGISARIDQQPPMHLFALSPDRYATRDGKVTMEFNPGDRGGDMLMSYLPDPRLAQTVVLRATLAQR